MKALDELARLERRLRHEQSVKAVQRQRPSKRRRLAFAHEREALSQQLEVIAAEWSRRKVAS